MCKTSAIFISKHNFLLSSLSPLGWLFPLLFLWRNHLIYFILLFIISYHTKKFIGQWYDPKTICVSFHLFHFCYRSSSSGQGNSVNVLHFLYMPGFDVHTYVCEVTSISEMHIHMQVLTLDQRDRLWYFKYFLVFYQL